MDVSKILAEIDAKIASLHQARAAILLLDEGGTAKPKRGRPKGSVNAAKPAKAKKRKRNLSPGAQAHCGSDEAPLGGAPQGDRSQEVTGL